MLALLVGAPAGAQSPNPVDLAEQAATDPSALESLRQSSPEAAEALTGTEGQVEERLDTLASQAQFQVDEDVSALAQDILEQERFGDARVSLSDEVQRRFSIWLNRLISTVLGNVPGGPGLFFGLLILGILAAAGVFASRLARGRIRATEAATLARIRRERGLSPVELRRRAHDAAQAGDHAEAVRLLFLAGLTALDERERIDFSPGTTTDEISQELASPTFDHVADQFNEIVYGGREAGAADFQASSSEWDSILGGSR